MAKKVDIFACCLEVSRNHFVSIDHSDTKGDECWRHVDVLECTAHRVFTTDWRQFEFVLHLECTEQCAEWFTPRCWAWHTFEILLIRETHCVVTTTCCHNFSTCFYHCISCTVVRAPCRHEWIETIRHHTCIVSETINWEFLYTHLSLWTLIFTTEWHQHCWTTDSGIECFDKTFLCQYVIVLEVVLEAFAEISTCYFTFEWVAFYHCTYVGFSKVSCTCRVDKFAREVNNSFATIEHTHTRCISYVCHMHHFDVLFGAIFHELFFIFRFNYHWYTFLRFRDSQFGSVQATIFCFYSVEIDVETIGQLTNSHWHTTCTKVVRFLNQTCNFWTTEQSFQFAFFRSITFLYFRRTCLDWHHVVLFRWTCCSTYAIATCTTTKHQHYITRSWRLATHSIGTHCTCNCTYFQAFCHIVRVINLTEVCCCKTYLVTIWRVTSCCFSRDNALWQFTLHSFWHRGIDIACTCHTHCLIYVCTTWQWVTNSTTKTCRRTTKWFNLCWVVMCFVFELEQPALVFAIYVNINKYRACVVLFALFHIVEVTMFFKIACTDSCHIHQATVFMFTTELTAHIFVKSKTLFKFRFNEWFVDSNLFEHCSKGCVTTVVWPICVENHQLCAIWVATLFVEILYHTTQVVSIHCQTILFAEWHEVGILHIAETFQHLYWLNLCIFIDAKHRHIFFATLYCIDCIFTNACKCSLVQLLIKQQQTSTTNAHVCLWVNQFNTIHRTCCALVELSR